MRDFGGHRFWLSGSEAMALLVLTFINAGSHSFLLHPVGLMLDFSPKVLHSFPASLYLFSFRVTKLLCQSMKM